MGKGFKMEDVPDDVLWVWSLEEANKYGNYIGAESYRKVQEVKKKYPRWFKKQDPWEEMGITEAQFDAIKMRRGGIGATYVRNKIFRKAMGLDKERRPSDFLDDVKVQGIPDFQWREHDREFFDLIVKAKEEGKQLVYTRGRRRELKIVDIMEKQVVEYMKASDIVEMFNLKGRDRREVMKFGKPLEKKLNGRSWTRRYEREWKKQGLFHDANGNRLRVEYIKPAPLRYYMDDRDRSNEDRVWFRILGSRTREDREYFAKRKAEYELMKRLRKDVFIL